MNFIQFCYILNYPINANRITIRSELSVCMFVTSLAADIFFSLHQPVATWTVTILRSGGIQSTPWDNGTKSNCIVKDKLCWENTLP